MKHSLWLMTSVALSVVAVGCGSSGKSEDGVPWNTSDDAGEIEETRSCGAGSSSFVGDSDGGGQEDAGIVTACGDPDGILRSSQELETVEGCEVVSSRISLGRYSGRDVDVLHSLQQTEDSIAITISDSLVSVEGFGRLAVVGGSFYIGIAPNLRSLDGLEGLRQVERLVALRVLTGLSSLAPLRNLERTGGLVLVDLPEVSSLDELKSLCLIEGDLTINNTGIAREDVAAFLERVEVTGTVTFNDEPWRTE